VLERNSSRVASSFRTMSIGAEVVLVELVVLLAILETGEVLVLVEVELVDVELKFGGDDELEDAGSFGEVLLLVEVELVEVVLKAGRAVELEGTGSLAGWSTSRELAVLTFSVVV